MTSVVAEPATALRVLHLGCGRKGTDVPFVTEPHVTVTTLDAEPFLRPDIICRLGSDVIPLPDNSVDVAVAHHVLEHIGRQGQTAEWFAFWEDLYRVLVPDGELRFESPMYDSVWCWADPTHVRALSPQALAFFSQDSYRMPGSAISPYRIRCDFVSPQPFLGVASSDPHVAAVEHASSFRGVLVAKKPLKTWWTDGD